MPLTIKKRLVLDGNTLLQKIETNSLKVTSVLAGFWLHPFLTINRLLQRTTLVGGGLIIGFTLLLLWLAELIIHPQPIGLWRRLLIWQELAWIILLLTAGVSLIALLYPREWKQIFSLIYFLPLPALWLLLRSVWVRLRGINLALTDFSFLSFTIFLFLLQTLIFYLWLRIINNQRPLLSWLILFLTFSWFYLFKQFLCLWF